MGKKKKEKRRRKKKEKGGGAGNKVLPVGGKRCGLCNRAGHSKRHCPDPSHVFPPGACFRCGEIHGFNGVNGDGTGGGNAGVNSTYISGKEEEGAGVCPRPDACPVCHGSPHMPTAVVVCPLSLCFRCGKPGHAVIRCPLRTGDSLSSAPSASSVARVDNTG